MHIAHVYWETHPIMLILAPCKTPDLKNTMSTQITCSLYILECLWVAYGMATSNKPQKLWTDLKKDR